MTVDDGGEGEGNWANAGDQIGDGQVKEVLAYVLRWFSAVQLYNDDDNVAQQGEHRGGTVQDNEQRLANRRLNALQRGRLKAGVRSADKCFIIVECWCVDYWIRRRWKEGWVVVWMVVIAVVSKVVAVNWEAKIDCCRWQSHFKLPIWFDAQKAV